MKLFSWFLMVLFWLGCVPFFEENVEWSNSKAIACLEMSASKYLFSLFQKDKVQKLPAPFWLLLYNEIRVWGELGFEPVIFTCKCYRNYLKLLLNVEWISRWISFLLPQLSKHLLCGVWIFMEVALPLMLRKAEWTEAFSIDAIALYHLCNTYRLQ